MPDVDEIGGWITGQLPAPIAKYKVPGAAIGVYRGGEVFAVAVGVLSHATKVEATADSVFQIGSITKTWTATLVMRPVVTYLPDFDLPSTAADGTQVLSAESAAAIRGKEAEVPPLGLMGTYWGLGFELFDFPGGFIFGHDGSTIGQSAFLRIVLGKDLAIALLANGGNPIGQYFDVYGHLLKELAGIDLPATPVPSASPKRIDAIRYLGVYANSVGKSTVTQDCDGRIWMTDEPLGEPAELIGEVERTVLVHLEGDTLIPLEPKYGIRIPQVFSGDDGSGRSLYIHSGRALRRAD
jgi:hypothetical protein